MSVIPTDLSSLLQNPNIQSMISNLGDKMSSDTNFGGGAIAPLLIGALLPRLFNNGVDAAVAANVLSAADVQNIVSANTNSQTLGSIDGEIWKAEGQLQAALAAATNAAQTATLNSEIANLQGQSVIVKAITEGATAIAKQGGEGVATTLATSGNVINTVTSGNSAILANLNQLNTNVLQGNYAVTQAVTSDGDKTRALLQSIETASLNREITVAQNEISNLRHHDAVAANGINVTNNINQNATATANAVAQQQIVGLLGQVATSLQHNTQSVVNLGSMIGSPQTATNVRT